MATRWDTSTPSQSWLVCKWHRLCPPALVVKEVSVPACHPISNDNRSRSYGVAPRVLSRHSLTKVLYDSLPDDAKAKVLAGKRVSDVSSTDDGVTVTCADGSSYDGTFVIGADGAHSKVRSCLRNLALAAGNEEVNVEKPFVTTFRCLWVRFSTADLGHVEAGETCETHGRGLSTQLFAGGDSGVAGLYEKLEKPTRERMRYTQADQEALVERWGHLPIVPNNKITVRELYEKRLESGLVSLEEGLVERWSWNSRVVLIGDAAHKFTPHTGTGCNQSILDVVALSNEIHKAVDEARANSGGKTSRPTAAQLAAAFTAYQDLRFDKVAIHCKVSGRSAKTAACISPFYRFMDRVVMSSPTITKYILGKGLSKESAMPVFQYLPGDEPFSGSVEWKNPIPTNQLVEKVF